MDSNSRLSVNVREWKLQATVRSLTFESWSHGTRPNQFLFIKCHRNCFRRLKKVLPLQKSYDFSCNPELNYWKTFQLHQMNQRLAPMSLFNMSMFNTLEQQSPMLDQSALSNISYTGALAQPQLLPFDPFGGYTSAFYSAVSNPHQVGLWREGNG